MAVNYSILTDVEFQTKGIQQKLQKVIDQSGVKAKVGLEVSGTDEVKELGKAFEESNLSVQAANELFRRTIDVIANVTAEVYKLDGALVEFKKVSDLSGPSLDNYVSQLANMGKEVARTGKPKRQAPNVGMVNQHLYLS